MKKLFPAALGAVLVALCLLAAPARAQVSPKNVPADSVFGPKSPLKYIALRGTFSTTANITNQILGAVPPGGCQVKDIVLSQQAAGAGGTSWVATVKRNAVTVSSTDGGFTVAAGASKVTNASSSPMGSLANPTGGTRPVLSGDAAATGTITVAASLAADEKVTIASVDIVAKASGAGNCQFNLGADENANAAALAAAINSCTTYPVQQSVKATVASAVVTVTARTVGTTGNTITLAKTGSHLTVSAATLTSGFSAMSAGGELLTLDVTLTGSYSTAVSGAVTVYCLPRY